MNDVRILSLIKKSGIFDILSKEAEKNDAQTFLLLSDDTLTLDSLVTLLECKFYCPDVCLSCNECRKVLSGNKVDVVEVNPNGESVSVADMRKDVISGSYVSAVEDGKKIYVIRNFSDLNQQNQNALLKTLEEPPENVVLLLTSRSTEGILPTVLSRVDKFNVPPHSPRVLKELLSYMGIADDGYIAKYAAGNLTMAKKIADDEKFLEKTHRIIEIFLGVKSSVDVVKYINDKVFDDFQEATFIMERILRDLLYYAADLEEKVATSFPEEYERLAAELDKNAVAAIMEEVNLAERKIAANCNNINVADSLLLKLAEEKAKCKK